MTRPQNSSDARALAAVARVRRVREGDSRAGLQLARHEVLAAQAHLGSLEDQLAGASTQGSWAPGEFVVLRDGILALGWSVTRARDELESATSLASSAQSHWQRDRMRLRTIEMLQERRAEEARVEQARSEAKVEDEIATQLWRRHRGEAVAR